MVLAVIKTILFARRTIILQILPAKIRKKSEKCKFFQKKMREGGRKRFEGTGLATLGHLENPNPCQGRDCGKSSCCALGLFVKARLQHVANTS